MTDLRAELDHSTAAVAPVDLEYLSERARAYVVGLEARNRVLRETNEQLRLEMAEGVERRAAQQLTKEYRRGWRDCAANFMNEAQAAITTLRSAHSAAASQYNISHKVPLAAEFAHLMEREDGTTS